MSSRPCLGAADLPLGVRQVLPASFGLTKLDSSPTSEVTLVHTPTHAFVAKRCRAGVYSEALEREHQVLVALAASELPIPRALALVTEPTPEGNDVWLVTTALPGRPLLAQLAAGGADDRVRWLTATGKLLRRIHDTPVPADLRDGSGTPWLDHVLARAGELQDRSLSATSQSAIEHLDDEDPILGRLTLVHGDFTLDNVLVTADGSLSVVDWGGAGAGDPRWDIALALATEPTLSLGPSEVAGFFTGYGLERESDAADQPLA